MSDDLDPILDRDELQWPGRKDETWYAPDCDYCIDEGVPQGCPMCGKEPRG